MSQNDPLIHPHSRLTTPAGNEVDIDDGMVPVIQALWLLGFTTTACCQDVGEATRGVREQKVGADEHRGDGFIAHHRGYALLKLPLGDALRLIELVGESPVFRDRMQNRFEARSWRMNVPIVHAKREAVLAEDAMIHFPSNQISELAQVLAGAQPHG